VQYISVRSLREAWKENAVKMEHPKGAQEGFEIRATWPSAVAKAGGTVEEANSDGIRYRKVTDNRSISIRTHRRKVTLRPLVAQGAAVQPNQIIASVVSVTDRFPCEGGATVERYVSWLKSASLSDRYAGAKALSRFEGELSTTALR